MNVAGGEGVFVLKVCDSHNRFRHGQRRWRRARQHEWAVWGLGDGRRARGAGERPAGSSCLNSACLQRARLRDTHRQVGPPVAVPPLVEIISGSKGQVTGLGHLGWVDLCCIARAVICWPVLIRRQLVAGQTSAPPCFLPKGSGPVNVSAGHNAARPPTASGSAWAQHFRTLQVDVSQTNATLLHLPSSGLAMT